MALVVKHLPANTGDLRDVGLIPGVGNSNPLQYSCLEKCHGGAWQAPVHGAAKSQTQLSDGTYTKSRNMLRYVF